MKRILVTYATMAGSTAEAARIVADEIGRSGLEVDLLPIEAVGAIDRYAGVILGAPMILGFHRGALRFLRRHRKAFAEIPLAVFALGMSLTETGTAEIGGVPIYVDGDLPKPPLHPGRLSLRERYATAGSYLGPVLRAVHPAKPVGLGIFGGRLEYGRLKPWAAMFAMLIVRAPAGDRRNPAAIRDWAASLGSMFGGFQASGI